MAGVKHVRIKFDIDQSDIQKTEANIKHIAQTLNLTEKEVNDVVRGLQKESGLLEKLDAEARLLEKSMKRAQDPKQIQQYNASLAATRKEMNTLATSGASARGTVGQLANQFGGLSLATAGVAGGIALAAKGLFDFASGGIELAGQMEQNKIAMENFTGSATEADKVLKMIEVFAAKTPFEFPELVGAAKKLMAFGVGTDELQDKLRRLGDLSAGTGKPIEELAMIYGKMLTKGKAGMEELNQLSEAGVPIIKALADSMGVTTQQVFKLSEQGKIGFTDVEKAINKMTDAGGKFSGLTEKQSQSLKGLQSTLIDNWNAIKRGLGEALLPIMKKVTTFLIDILNGFDKWKVAFEPLFVPIKLLGQGIGFIAEKVASLVGASDSATTAMKVAGAAIGTLTLGPIYWAIRGFNAVRDSIKEANEQAKAIERWNFIVANQTMLMQNFMKITGATKSEMKEFTKTLGDFTTHGKTLDQMTRELIDRFGAWKKAQTDAAKATEETGKQIEFAAGSLEDLNEQMRILTEQQSKLATNRWAWRGWQMEIDKVTEKIKELKGEVGGVAPPDDTNDELFKNLSTRVAAEKSANDEIDEINALRLETETGEYIDKWNSAIEERIGKDIAAAEQMKQISAIGVQQAHEITNSVFQIYANFYESRLNLEKQNLEELKQAELSAKNLTEKQKENIEKKYAERSAEIDKQLANKKKTIAIGQALINGALGVTKIWSEHGTVPYVAAALTAIEAAVVAAEIAVIASQKFAKGGFTGAGNGRTDETGQPVAGVVHANEFVFDRNMTRQWRPIFEAMHKKKLSPQDVFGGGNITVNATTNNKQIVDELRKTRESIEALNRRSNRRSSNFTDFKLFSN